MTRQQATHQQLTDRDDSVLIVVDVQRSFVDKLNEDAAESDSMDG